MAAITGGDMDAMHALLAAGADKNGRMAAGWTPLHAAVEHEQADAVEALLAWGAQVNAQNDEGSTPLHLAVDVTCDGHNQDGAPPEGRLVRQLLRHGADPSVLDAEGRTAAHVAAAYG